MGLSVLPTRRASWRCVGTVLESLLTPLLLLWSCAAQYGVVLPTTLRGMSPRPAPASSSAGGGSSGVATAAEAATEDVLVWARRPVLWGVLGSVLYGVLFVLAFVHYLRVVTVDNCPDVHPYDEEAEEEQGPAAAAGEQHAEEEEEEEGRGLAPPDTPFPRCPKCGGPKPARCHHCSQCRRCCLKMDHHCPWMGNCIGFFNYKFFVNFLAWTALLCTLVAVEAVPYLLVFLRATTATATNYVQALHISILGFGLSLSPSLVLSRPPADHNQPPAVAMAMLFSVLILLEAHIGFVFVNATTLESHGGVCATHLSLSLSPLLCHVFLHSAHTHTNRSAVRRRRSTAPTTSAAAATGSRCSAPARCSGSSPSSPASAPATPTPARPTTCPRPPPSPPTAATVLVTATPAAVTATPTVTATQAESI